MSTGLVSALKNSLSTEYAIQRRGVLVGLSAASLMRHPLIASAADQDLVDCYFGVGCFWHVQHEIVMAEKRLLGREDMDLTARSGYAGGLATSKDAALPGKSLVCYHNFQRIADYGKLGHAEAVGVRIPAQAVTEFTKEYTNLFSARGDRPDVMDFGPEYRSILGLPGGAYSAHATEVANILQAKGLQLIPGKGNDPDTLGKRTVWLYDTAQFPLHQAEIYHQMHDGFFPGEDYPAQYNALNRKLFEAGRLEETGCPDIV